MTTIQGHPIEILGAFAAGLAVSFTPCVYPILPLTAAFLGGCNPTGGRGRAFILSVIYVSGMALTYAGLAVTAALSGRVFGRLQSTPVLHLIVALVLVWFGLSMGGWMRFPSFIGRCVSPGGGRRGVLGLLVGGVTAGLMAGPCTAPALGALLVFVASRRDLVWGVVLMTAFAYGLGGSLILVGTFSGLLARLPRGGPWMVWVQKGCAGFLLAFAMLYFIQAWDGWRTGM